MTEPVDLNIDYARETDLDWLMRRDDVPGDVVRDKIGRREYILAWINGEPVGYMRISLFWSRIPMIDMVRVEEKHRGRGAGRAMLDFLEQREVKAGRRVIMSSSQVNEPRAQAWHQKVGFTPAGAIVDFKSIQEVPELIFIKEI